MFYTGLAQKIGAGVVKLSGTGENSLMFGIMLVGAALSAVLSNTGTAACLLPVVLGICAAAKIPASRQLMPLAFACGLGGIITMLATGTGLTMKAESFLNYQTILIICLGLIAFAGGTAAGVLFGQVMKFADGGKTNPLIGSAGVSAVPMAARVSQIVGQKANPGNFLLMHDCFFGGV